MATVQAGSLWLARQRSCWCSQLAWPWQRALGAEWHLLRWISWESKSPCVGCWQLMQEDPPLGSPIRCGQTSLYWYDLRENDPGAAYKSPQLQRNLTRRTAEHRVAGALILEPSWSVGMAYGWLKVSSWTLVSPLSSASEGLSTWRSLCFPPPQSLYWVPPNPRIGLPYHAANRIGLELWVLGSIPHVSSSSELWRGELESLKT